jgi:HD-like signal output (HDOD) protein
MQSFEESFIWGLLHDFGKIVLATHFTEEFTQALQVMQENGIHLREAEGKILGADHAEVGGIVADKWNLPPALIKSIRFHHDPPMANESMRMAAIVHIADILCRAIGLGNGADNKVPEINEESWKLLNMDKAVVKKLLAQIENELASAMAFLSIVK